MMITNILFNTLLLRITQRHFNMIYRNVMQTVQYKFGGKPEALEQNQNRKADVIYFCAPDA